MFVTGVVDPAGVELGARYDARRVAFAAPQSRECSLVNSREGSPRGLMHSGSPALGASLPLLHRVTSHLAGQMPRWLQLGLYRLPLVSPGIRWLLTQHAPDRPVPITVVSGPLSGVLLYVNLKSQKYYWLGTHERHMQAAICKFVGEGDVVYDLGAHIGFFSVLFGMIVGRRGEVHCFEPLPANVEVLQKQLAVNRLADVAKVVPAAVGSNSCTSLFRTQSSTSTGRLCRVRSGARDIHVNVISLDDHVALGNRPPDVIKMDVEGSGGSVIMGTRQILERYSPILLAEFHSATERRSVWQVVAEAGYRCFAVGPNLRECADPLETGQRHFCFTATRRCRST